MSFEENISGKLYRGDCLSIASVLPRNVFDLIYLDPPFLTGVTRVGANGKFAYRDNWPGKLDEYLPWLKKRIEAMIPLLSACGSLVVHLDCRTVHYVKVMLDEIFGYDRFVNEIVWHYTGGGRSKTRFSNKHDTLLWYSNASVPRFNIEAIRVPYNPSSGYAKSGIVSARGKLYRPNPKGTPVDDVWDIPIINPLSKERTGYPTQKPLQLMERLIAGLTFSGDLVGDFFCGSGSTLVAAHRLDRRWAGGDTLEKAVECTSKRLEALIEKPIYVTDLKCDKMNFVKFNSEIRKS